MISKHGKKKLLNGFVVYLGSAPKVLNQMYCTITPRTLFKVWKKNEWTKRCVLSGNLSNPCNTFWPMSSSILVHLPFIYMQLKIPQRLVFYPFLSPFKVLWHTRNRWFPVSLGNIGQNVSPPQSHHYAHWQMTSMCVYSKINGGRSGRPCCLWQRSKAWVE